MEAALVLKENSQQPWKTIEERAASAGSEGDSKVQSVATASRKEAADVKPHSRRLMSKLFTGSLTHSRRRDH